MLPFLLLTSVQSRKLAIASSPYPSALFSFHPYLHHSIRMSFRLSICLLFRLSNRLSFHLSTRMPFVFPPACSSVFPSVCPSVFPIAILSVFPSLYPSVFATGCPPIRLLFHSIIAIIRSPATSSIIVLLPFVHSSLRLSANLSVRPDVRLISSLNAAL